MNNEIVSSTGGAGITKRSFNRWYYNYIDEPVSSPEQIQSYFDTISSRRWRRRGRRDVFRGLVCESALESFASNGQNRELIEVAFPVQNDMWYLNAAKLYGRRRSIRPIKELKREIDSSQPVIVPKEQLIHNVLDEGHTFVVSLHNDNELQKQLLSLWGKTFGWDKKKIANFAKRLEQQGSRPEVWFSAIRDKNGRLTAAAMAEKMSVQGESGRQMDIIESTEWRSIERDHMKAVVDHLHAQVIHSYGTHKSDYMIIAECNINSKAYRVGQKSQMVVPEGVINGYPISQILVQNVKVVDGKKPCGLRDFAFMYLPKDAFTRQEAENILLMTRH